MTKYKVVEIFESINGEGMRAGELAIFIRMQGCNLCCRYCDTTWANTPDIPYRLMDAAEIYAVMEKFGARNITLTGGEPLLQDNVEELLLYLTQKGYDVEIETNGSVKIEKYRNISPKIRFTMDYKLAGSGMEDSMQTDNFSFLDRDDTVKFVVSDRKDLERAAEICEKYGLGKKCNVLLSPVFGQIAGEEIVTFMREKRWVDARLQIQMHKVIWDPEKRGV